MIRLWPAKSKTQPATKIQATAEVEIIAGEADENPKVRIIAYNGGQMRVPNYGSIVVDIQGMSLPQSIPLLLDHETKIDAVAGSGRPTQDGRSVVIEGTIARGTEAGDKVLALHKAGVKLQASIGAEPSGRWQDIRDGETITANGQTFKATGPVRFFSKTKLKETSLVAIGADDTTSVDIAASQGATMPQLEDETAFDVERINAICRSDTPDDRFADIRAEAIADSWSIENTKKAVLDRIRNERPDGPIIGHAGYRPTGEVTEDILACALTMFASGDSVAEKCYGEHTCERAKRYRPRTLMDFASTLIQARGEIAHTSWSKDDLLRAAYQKPAIQATSAFTTFSMATTFNNAMNKRLLNEYAEAPATWESFVTTRLLTDFKEARQIRPTFDTTFSELPATGEIPNGTMGEVTYGMQMTTFAELRTVSRKDVINDSLGFLSTIPRGLAMGARRKLNDIVWRSILSNVNFDGETHWSAANNNVLTTGSAFRLESLADAIKLIRSQKDESGYLLDLQPATLVVSDDLEMEARQLINSAMLSRDLNVDQQGTANPIPDLNLQIEPRLSEPATYTNANPLAWYLFTSRENASVFVGYLNGRSAPHIEFSQADFNVLGVSYRCYLDAGAWLGDPKASVRATGGPK